MEENLLLAGFFLMAALFGAALYVFFRRWKLHRSGGMLRLAAGNLLLFAFLASLLVCAFEIHYRFFYDATDINNLMKISQRWFARHWGDREKDLPSGPPPQGKRRVLFVGDSYTIGHGLKDPESCFGNIYRHGNPDQEVHILARCGLETQVQLYMLEHAAAQGYPFDLVVLCYCLNDIEDLVPEIIGWLHHVRRYLQPECFLFKHSYFLNTLYWRWSLATDEQARKYHELLLAGYKGQAWHRHKQRLQKLKDLVESRGGRLVVMTFPFLMGDLGPGYSYRPVHQQLNAFWRELNVSHLDLLPVYENLPTNELTVNSHDPHPNERAHALAADALMEFLEDKFPKKKRP